MNTLREAAQQALEALGSSLYPQPRQVAAIAALKAALADGDNLSPSEPLTDAEIQAIWAKTFERGSSANTFARAIEQAHGIKS